MPNKNSSDENLEKLRESRNKELIRKMRNGEPLTSFNSQSSWFPPRPIISKNEKEIERLYGSSEAMVVRSTTKKASREENLASNVVPLGKKP